MTNVLFVCLGNICRSSAAEGVFLKLIADKSLQGKLNCDSAGTSAYHRGEEADGRMQYHAEQRGYKLESLSRPFSPPEDFENFDWIITMDDSNYNDVLSMDTDNKYKNKIIKMCDLCTIHDITYVPDPYIKGDDGFELVMDIVEDGCHALIKKIS